MPRNVFLRSLLIFVWATTLLLLIVFSISKLCGQVPGSTGRTTAPGTAGTFTFILGIGTINCSGSPCNQTSSTVSPGSQAVSGTLTFNASHDAALNIGGASGGGAGVVEVSCDSGSTWITIAIGSGSIGSPTMSYPPSTCSGPTNLNTLLFRSTISGAGGGGFNMVLQSSSQVVITW
jgi:hypothetical protein